MKADLDARIIAALQRNGRATYRELAEEVGAPRAAVSARVQELIESGVIEVVAVARPELLGINAMAHVSITVADEVEPVARAICASPSAVYVSAVTGSYHLLAELRVQTDRDLYDEIAEIRALPGVLSVSTLYYSDVLRGVFMPQGPLSPQMSLDDTDVAIIDHLSTNGRMPFHELAHRTGLSQSAVRNRVHNLVASTAVRVGAVVKRRGDSRSLAVGFGVGLGAGGGAASDSIGELPGIEFLARTLGRYDLVGTLVADSSAAVFRILERMRALDGVVTVDSWTHLEVYKERYTGTVPRPRRAGRTPANQA